MANKNVLPNGLRIVTEKIPTVKSVAVGVWIRTGVVTEGELNNGISHFIEHMLFKGTRNRSARSIAETVDGVGGHINAFTSREYTCYYMKVLDENLDLAVELLSDMIFNSIFDEEEIEKEKSVIAEEISMYEDSPEDLAHDLLIENMFKGQSLGYSILGHNHTIEKMNRERLQEYLHQQYRPKNSVLAVAGNYDEYRLSELIQKHFGDWREDVSEDTVSQDSPTIRFGQISRQKDIEQIHLNIGYQGAALGSDEMYDLLVINNIVGGSMSSRLFQKIREDRGLVYSIYSTMHNYTQSGIFTLYCSMNPGQLTLVQELIDEELNELTTNGFTTDEFEKARRQLKGSYLLGMESTSGRMASMGKSELLLYQIDTPDDILRKINALEQSKAEAVMRQYLNPQKKTIILVGRIGY
ncbi:MAG: pitrilysin family protein [Bacillota bacterium]|nr:pitrilysin family protein [Bacillota bacterium]MDW7676046.1 pitrilysin family protein [Bacillota bacterium]